MSISNKRTRKKSPFCGLLHGFYNTAMLDDEAYNKESCKQNNDDSAKNENQKKCFHEVYKVI